MVLQALIGLNGPDTSALVRAGQAIPRPVAARALIDPGSDRTAAASHVFQQLGLGPFIYGTSQTAGGSFQVNLYRVSLTISGSGATAGPTLVQPDLLVSELTVPLPFDVLIGLDVLRECLLVLDGPGEQFILGF
jgi:hypothetical protein